MTEPNKTTQMDVDEKNDITLESLCKQETWSKLITQSRTISEFELDKEVKLVDTRINGARLYACMKNEFDSKNKQVRITLYIRFLGYGYGSGCILPGLPSRSEAVNSLSSLEKLTSDMARYVTDTYPKWKLFLSRQIIYTSDKPIWLPWNIDPAIISKQPLLSTDPKLLLSMQQMKI